GSTTMRDIPDVALTADNVFVVYDNGATGDFGGTSCATPLWAAFTALVNQHGAAHGQSPVGFINPAVYAIGKGANYTSVFHDITTGNNTNSASPANYFAVSGYDLCTGWGTPNGSNMINALLPGLSPIPPTVTWTNPAAFVYGAALGASQLNAKAAVSGTFSYSPPAGTVLNAGANVLSVVFAPNDTFDYNRATNTVTQVVTPAALSVTVNNATRVYGQGNPPFSGSISGLKNGDVITASYTCAATTSSAVGTYPIVPNLSDPGNRLGNYSVTTNNGQLTISPASSALALSSSANPSLAGSNVTFTATVTAVFPGGGTPAGAVQFLADGSSLGSPVALVGGVAGLTTASLSLGAHAISAQYAGNGNFFGSSGSLSPNESILTPPVAASIVLQRETNSGAKVSVAALLANDADPDGGTLTLLSAGPTSTNGGTIAVTNNWIFYTPPPGSTNPDAFSYVIADSGGLQSTGTVSITIEVDLSQSQNIVAIEDLGNDASLVQFQGIPARAYSIQYTESLETPVWQTLGTSTADTTGAFEFTDAPPTGSPARFYRSTQP
ncbi:MAG: Ig-like domain repeat protein, partial [Verrucomicrobiota bacterium]